ncbi:MAG: hypothetical protein ACOYB1_11665 [Limnohabitans sp.]
MNQRPSQDLARDAVLFGDLRNLTGLKEIQKPTEDDVRAHSAAVRRLLLEGELPAAAGRRRLPLLFYPVDSNPLLRAARNNYLSAFCLWDVEVFGVQFAGVAINSGTQPFGEDFNPESSVPLKLDSFLKQTVAMSPPLVSTPAVHPPKILSPSILLTRYDILLYVANKIGGVHYDPMPKGHLSEEKLRGLGRMRRVFQIGLVDGGTPTIGFNMDTFEEDQSSKFRYEPEKIDAVYLEFISAIELILSSPEVCALQTAIAHDLGVAS